jgi:hypothetical protein
VCTKSINKLKKEEGREVLSKKKIEFEKFHQTEGRSNFMAY